MSLNIKSERAVALVRELAARTGASQTAAVEDAVARRLSELDRDEKARATKRIEAVKEVLSRLNGLLSDADKREIRQGQEDLYDANGLPR